MTDTGSSHRHPLLRKLSLFLFAVILLLAGFALYLQTQHAFRHVIFPLVAAVVPAELRVSNGSLTFPATLELTGLSYQRPDGGLSLQIDHLLCRISVMAWLREHLLFVEELDLKNGNLHMASEMTPSSREGKTATATAPKTAVMVPFVVQRARLDHITLSIQAGDDEITIRDLKLSIDDVGADRTGTIDLQSEVALSRSVSQSRWAGTLLLTGTFEESSGDRQLKWNVSNRLTVREWPEQGAVADSSPITIDQTVSGRYDFTLATMHADSSLTLRQGKTSLGDVSLTFTRTESPDGTVMDVGMKLQRMTDEALNLMLGNDEAFRLRTGHMSGDVKIHAVGERYEVRSAFTGQQLQVVSGKGATPPVDVNVAQVGIFDVGSRHLTLDIFELRVVGPDHVLLAGELKHALTINLETNGMEHKGVSTQNAPQADWLLTINDIGVAELRQWCDAFGWKGLRDVRTGQLAGTVTLSSRENGNAIDLNTRLTISNLRMASAEKHIDRTSLKFAHEIQGTVTNLTFLRLHSWIMTASVHDRSVGALRLSGAIDLRAPTRDPKLEGSFTLTGLPGGALNPLLAFWSDARINRALFNGAVGIKMTGDLLSWKIDLRGDQISLRLSEMHQATAPLDLVVTQSGSFDRTTGVLRLDKGMLQELKQSRPVLTAALNKPVRFTLPGKGADGKALQSPDGQVATFTVQAHHIGIDQLRPRLALWGVSTLNGVKTGVIDGRWIIQAQGGTAALSVAGTLDVKDLRLDAGSIHINTPISVRSRIAATMTEFSRIRVEALNLEALAEASLIAKADLSGQTNVDDGSTDLAITFTTDNMAKLLDRTGLLDERQRRVFTGGKVSAEGHLRGRGQEHSVSAQATIHARELRFQPLQGQFLTYSLLAEGTAELNKARTDLELSKIGMTLESQEKPAGTLTIAGTWPIAASTQGGAITVVTKDLDTAPLVDVFGVFPGREHGPLPVSGDVAITQDSTNGSLVVRGQELLGPIRIARKGEGGEPNEATFRIEHNLSRQNDEIRLTGLTVTADRPGGRPDRVTASGAMRIAGQPGAQLRVEIASLDAAWHAALFSRPDPMPQTSENQAGGKDREGRTEPSNSLAFLTNLDAELSIGSISYNNLMIGPGRVIAKGTGERLEVKLEPTVIADGLVDAIVTLVRQNKQTQLTWSGKGQGLSVEPIMQAALPGREAVLKGTGSVMTSGSGLLNEEPFRTHASGTVNFDIADGQFIRSPMLQFLARHTHISELERMGFDDFQGKVRLEGGWIHADSLVVTGPLASLEGNVSVSPDDAADGRIFVKIGPSLGKKIKIPCMSALLKTSNGFTALPFAVRVNGPMKNLTFSADTAGWNNAKGGVTSLADTMKNLLRGCREAPSEEGAK
ncbi:hypothetical protein AYO43_05635 [Nitrospira sp. SCGC AG-212-E16]|nr:hypothetical protein AYO43_05635 [Nitrospira sp. SCGC AG-212-E16]